MDSDSDNEYDETVKHSTHFGAHNKFHTNFNNNSTAFYHLQNAHPFNAQKKMKQSFMEALSTPLNRSKVTIVTNEPSNATYKRAVYNTANYMQKTKKVLNFMKEDSKYDDERDDELVDEMQEHMNEAEFHRRYKAHQSYMQRHSNIYNYSDEEDNSEDESVDNYGFDEHDEYKSNAY
jgi:hypothetical protein